jgi:hypothetical protein
MKNLSEHAQNIMMSLRAENRILALEMMTRYQDEREKKNERKNRDERIKKEDLVLIRNKIRDNQKRRKLNAR